MQIPLFKPQTEWLPPENFPDLSKYDEIAIDLETKDPDLIKMGSGSVVGKGDVIVVEADEFDRTFLRLTPSIAIITNIEAS